MPHRFKSALHDVAALVRAGRLHAATAALRRALGLTSQPSGPSPTGAVPRPPAPPTRPAEAAGDVHRGAFASPAGTRHYRLHVPTRGNGRPGLILMLHGCTQDAEAFAFATRMDRIGADGGYCALYPSQSREAHATGCWNWFEPADQLRDRGEPAILAELTRRVVADYAVDPRRVHVAGLSAGGAMALVMAATYPDLFASFAVHSGLPYRVAHDTASALALMHRGPALGVDLTPLDSPRPGIVFHGDCDTTVHPINAAWTVAQALGHRHLEPLAGADIGSVFIEQGQAPEGLPFSRTCYRDAAGDERVELWLVHGCGHAWSGGAPGGSYTEPRGPDASREAVRFFAAHPR